MASGPPSPNEAPRFCDNCMLVGRSLDSWIAADKIDSLVRVALGSLEEMELKPFCLSCQSVVAAWPFLFEGSTAVTRTTPLGFGRVPGIGRFFIDDHAPSDTSRGHGPWLLPVSLPDSKLLERYPDSRGRLFDPEYVDLGLIKLWIETCRERHGKSCGPSMTELGQHFGDTPNLHNINLVDVKRGCLVSKSITTRYLALSYVWGNVSSTSTRTTRANISAMGQGGSLDSESRSFEIPETIRDAMRLTLALGETYLWVDSLCIIQDDEAKLKSSIKSMGEIYSRAYFTIVAAEGEDAGYGIHGATPKSKPRDVKCVSVNIANRVLMPSPGGQRRVVYGTKWTRRGWTFQEGVSSRRVVVFNKFMQWACCQSVWTEATISGREFGCLSSTESEPESFLCLRFPLKPSMNIFCRILEGYNSRDLTVDADAYNALAGTLYSEPVALPGGFIHGLPKLCFDIALLWQPFWVTGSDAPIRRRIPSSDSKLVLPSWSWAGWQAVLDLSCWRRTGPLMPFSSSSGSWRTDHLVDWHQVTACGCFKTKIIQSARQPAHRLETLPLNAAHAARNSIANTPDKTTFLACRAQRAFMTTCALISLTHRDVMLASASGQAAGVVRLSWIPEIAAPAPGHGRDGYRYPYSERCELIAISKGWVHEVTFESVLNRPYFGEWRCRQGLVVGGKYAFYNVMWIEWKEGIAYRRAVGRVVEHVWEGLSREEVDVILG